MTAPVDGIFNVDKPLGMTSTQAVGKVRWLYSAEKAGPAGTLDLLVIVIDHVGNIHIVRAGVEGVESPTIRGDG